MIEFRGVNKSYAGVRVLEDLSFTVRAGEVCALLGLSGSGKTTALKLACGLQFPDSGEISVDGKRVRPETLPQIRARLGYVIQDGGLFPHLTGRGNLLLITREAGWSREQTAARMDELLRLTNLDAALLEKYPRQLSGGQRQRVSLMRALLRDPPILLLDEPMGALDPITRRELQGELRELCRTLGKTALLVTHDLHEAGFLADQILLLHEGRVVQRGLLAELIEAPANAFVEKFVSSQILQAERA